MGLKELWAKIDGWWTNRTGRRGEPYVAVDEDGLICDEGGGVITAQPDQKRSKTGGLEIVKRSGVVERKENIEKLGKAFDSLIDQLGGINEHLGKQVAQHENLMKRINELPELLENVPNSVENQRQLVDGLIEQLKGKALKEQQFVDIVEKIPAETSKQTNALTEMNRKLSVATDIDAQINENFNKFNKTLDKLDADTVSQTDSIIQMSKTFTTSDRYLKYVMSRQHKRFMWVFSIAIGVCVLAIIILAGIILIVMKT